MSFRIGTDIGGTFTDLTLSRDGELLGRFKSPTTPTRLADGVLTCVALAADASGLSAQQLLTDTEVFVHGSTIATNAVLEGKVARCGVIATRGTRYTLWRGEGRRSDIFDFTQGPREPLVAPRYCVEIDERIDRDGHVVTPLDEASVIDAIAELRASGCDAVAVCLLWSIRNPDHEQRVAELIAEHWPQATVSISSVVQPVLREYTRMSCTVLNAMLKPVVAAYLQDLQAALRQHGLAGEVLVVASDGGVQPIAEIAERPVYMLFSGPSTGPSAAHRFARQHGAEDCLLIDMGGTSFDVSTVIDGRITMTRDGRINGHPTGLAAVEILTLGAGGGSIARVDSGGLLRVGPDSAGAEPGPACYGRGGSAATVTDAYAVLGYLAPDRFLGGRMTLSLDAARTAIHTDVAAPLGLDVEQAALGILNVVNERMINGILEMTVRRGIDPRGLLLVTAGGATGVAALELARELGITRVLVPRETSVLCAFGALNAELTWSSVISAPTRASDFDSDAVNQALAPLRTAGAAFLDRLDVPAALRRSELYASARYPLQVTELEIPCPDSTLKSTHGAQLAESFHATYRERYTIDERDNDVEFVMWRLVAAGSTAPTRSAAAPGRSDDADGVTTTHFYDSVRGTMVEAPLIDPDRMAAGQVQEGPALLVAVDTTVVLPSGARAMMTEHGYLAVELEC